MKLLNFENWSSGIILENKLMQKMMLSKNVNIKTCAPKCILIFTEKKIRKIRMIFDIENEL